MMSVAEKVITLEPCRNQISFNTFELMLKESTQSNPIRIGWRTEEGNNRYYFA
jgi:hypothetical protein